MVFKSTKIKIMDNSGLLKAKVFHVYGSKHRNSLSQPGFVYSSIRDTYQSLQNYIGKKKRIFVVQTRKVKQKKDSSFFIFLKNGGVTIKKRTSIMGKFSKGPFPFTIKRRKLSSSFNTLI